MSENDTQTVHDEIEHLTTKIQARGESGRPAWLEPDMFVEVTGIPGFDSMDYSGQLRTLAENCRGLADWVSRALIGAADRLDEAHLEWLKRCVRCPEPGVYVVTLSNGVDLGVSESRSNGELSLGLWNEDEVERYICSMSSSGVRVYPNSGEAPDHLTRGLKHEPTR